MPTKAGEALLNHGRATYRTMWIGADMENLVLAIEAEAVAVALDALAKKVAAEVSSNPEGMNHPTSAFTTGWNRALAAVLAAIEKARR